MPAGQFSTWIAEIRAALRGERDAEVACGECTACCTGSQFIHVGPDETDTLSHIPRELLFPAPGRPAGHVLMGYDEQGHCPMLVDDVCTIYEHRPRTCRTYDCRVFPAAGVEPEDELIAARARRWQFEFPTETDTQLRAAVRAAVAYTVERHVELGDDAPASPGEFAVMAVELHDLFLRGEPEVSEVRVELARRRPD